MLGLTAKDVDPDGRWSAQGFSSVEDARGAATNHYKRDTQMQTIDDIIMELQRAIKKFPAWPDDPLHALAVLGEEYGELTKEVLQLTYEPHKTSLEKVKTEAIQTAAMALRFVASLEQYKYVPSMQHPQGKL